MTPGILPSAAPPPAALFAPLLRRSACAKKGNQRNTPPAARSPGIRQLLLRCSTSGIHAVACPASARGCYGVCWMYIRVHSSNGRTSGNCSCVALPRASMPSRVRPPADFSYASSPRLRGPRFGRHPAAEAKSRSEHSSRQCRDTRIHGSRRRSRCRASQPSREKPAGSRRGIAAIAKRHRDCAV